MSNIVRDVSRTLDDRRSAGRFEVLEAADRWLEGCLATLQTIAVHDDDMTPERFDQLMVHAGLRDAERTPWPGRVDTTDLPPGSEVADRVEDLEDKVEILFKWEHRIRALEDTHSHVRVSRLEHVLETMAAAMRVED